MTINRSEYVTEIAGLPGSENAVRFDGHEHGASVSFFIMRNRPGTGPKLHKHRYDETFIMQEGEARFTVGDESIEAAAGEIVVVEMFRILGGGVMGDLAGFPKSRLAVLPATSHFIPLGSGMLDHADLLAPMIGEFLDASEEGEGE